MFTLFQQLEGKVNVFNNIIIDLKKANEASMMMFDNQMNFIPESFIRREEEEVVESHTGSYSDSDPEITKKEYILPVHESIVPQVHTIVESEEVVQKSTTHMVEANYESMTYKELQAEGKRKQIKGVSKMTKAEIIESLRKYDTGSGSGDLDGMLINNPFENFPSIDETTGEFIPKFEDEEIIL